MRCVSLLFVCLSLGILRAQNTTTINFPKSDTITLTNRSNFIPKWSFETNPVFGFGGNYSFYGFGLSGSLNINELFNVNAGITEQVFDRSTIKDEINFTTNFFLNLEYSLLKKSKSRKSFYLKRFKVKTLNIKYKPLVLYQNLKLLNLNIGLRKSGLNNRLTNTSDFAIITSNSGNSSFDTNFDNSEYPVDYDGFINELRTIRLINHYALNLGLNYSVNKNYNFSIKDQKIARNNKHEVYVNFMYGLFYNIKYDGRIENPNIDDDFEGKIDSKKIGWNVAYKITKSFKNNRSSLHLNLEFGFLPDFVYNRNFHYELSKKSILSGSFSPSPWGSFYNDDYYRYYRSQYRYLQLSIGYTFGQKIK